MGTMRGLQSVLKAKCRHPPHPFFVGELSMKTTLSIKQIVEEWVLSLDCLPSTKEDYRRKIRLWFQWLAQQGLDTRSPTRQHILQYKEFLQQQMKSAYTYYSYLTVVRLFYRYCSEQGYYNDIGQKIQSSLHQRTHCKYPLTVLQAQRLLDSIKPTTIVGKRDLLMVSMMLMLGLRTCEINRIDIGDVGFVESTPVLRVQRKGHLDKRAVLALPARLVELFEDYIAERDFKQDEPLFINHCKGRKPTRLLTQTISHIIKERLRSIGIDDKRITAHSLRHTCGSLLVEQGVEVEIIKELLGHTTTSTTRIYVDMALKRKLLEDNPSDVIADIVAKKPKN